MDKILLVNKPAGWTSFDVVAKIRGKLKKEIETQDKGIKINSSKKIKVGHTGTLDPFATGLLIVLTGKMTKDQNQFVKLDKEYLATLKLGATSTTGDPEGVIKEVTINKPKITKKDIDKVLENFIGEIEQTPPAFSAIKVCGKRAYQLARKGQKVNIKPRKIQIKNIKSISYNWPFLKIKVSCSSGTYIRTLAEDIGKNLGYGAYLTELERTRIGNFKLKDAKKIEEISLT